MPIPGGQITTTETWTQPVVEEPAVEETTEETEEEEAE